MIEIELSGVRYSGFTGVSVTRDIETLCADFTMEATTLERGNFPIKRAEPCKIFIDDEKVFTGYVDTINVGYDKDSHTVSVAGRDRTEDIVDSTVDATVEIKTPVSLEGVIKTVLRFIGSTDIEVINQVKGMEPFSASEKVSGEVGKKAFDFLHEFSAKRQVLLTSNEDGNILITEGEGVKTSANIINKIGGLSNNVKRATVNYDDTKRFYKYVMRSQPNTTKLTEEDEEPEQEGLGDDDDDDFPDIATSAVGGIKSQAVDNSVRKSRLIVMNAEKVSTTSDAKDRAAWERDMRNARAISYKPTMQGHHHGGNTGPLWKPLQLVTVLDEFCGVDDQLIVRSVAFRFNLQDGNITDLDLVPKNTYKLLEEEDKTKKKKKKGGGAPTEAEINQVKYQINNDK